MTSVRSSGGSPRCRAQRTAERVRAEAQGRAGGLDAEVATRRVALLDAREQQKQDVVQLAVGELRSFGSNFRANLTGELMRHISALEARHAQPARVHALASDAAL